MSTSQKERKLQRGLGSEERPLTKVLWERDSRAPNAAMKENGDREPSRRTVDFARYYDPDYAKAEHEKLWLRTWLYAAREEDFPNVGDRVPFDVGKSSFLIVRTGDDSFKAYYNSCLHRGTKLCNSAQSGEKIVCPFHAWEWKLDGSLSHIPSHWDFSSVTRGNAKLREVQVGRWGGFIFVNADPNAAPLEDALSVLPRHFADFQPERRYTAAHFRKLMPANWKVVQEAFLEAYHVVGTHPEAVPYNGDSQSQYEVWSSDHGHVGRLITPSAVPSMLAPPEASAFEAAMVYATIMVQWHYPDAEMPMLDPAKDLRAQLGDWHRRIWQERYGREPNAPDAVMIDSILYHVFPQFTLWLSESIPFAYQFLPHESDPEKSYFDVRMLMPYREGDTRPPRAPRVDVGIDGLITNNVPAFGFLAMVFDQDIANMPLIQQGLRAADPTRAFATLGAYQEMIIQHWNDVRDMYMSD